MKGLLGEYEVTLDAKGRFLFPAGLRKQLPENAMPFVVNRGMEKCLTLYPQQTWDPLYTRISKLNDFDPKVREFRRFFLNGATELEPDTAGRVLLPPNLREYAGLTKDIILVSAGTKVEIWNSEVYKKLIENTSPQGVSDLAYEVLGKEMES